MLQANRTTDFCRFYKYYDSFTALKYSSRHISCRSLWDDAISLQVQFHRGRSGIQKGLAAVV